MSGPMTEQQAEALLRFAGTCAIVVKAHRPFEGGALYKEVDDGFVVGCGLVRYSDIGLVRIMNRSFLRMREAFDRDPPWLDAAGRKFSALMIGVGPERSRMEIMPGLAALADELRAIAAKGAAPG